MVLQKKVLIISLIVAILITSTLMPVKKAEAALPVAIGGLAIGEGALYLAAAIISGYSLYEAYQAFQEDSLSMQLLTTMGAYAWNRLSSASKEAWAAIEESIINGATTLSLTASQWLEALKLALTAFSTDLPLQVPIVSLPENGTNIPYDAVITQEYVNQYAAITFLLNGEEFAYIPVSRFDNLQNSTVANIMYNWVLKMPDGTYRQYQNPASTAGFVQEYMQFYVKTAQSTLMKEEVLSNNQVVGWHYKIDSFQNVIRAIPAAMAAYAGYLQLVYGGVAIPAPWVPEIPQEKDLTKPVAIPVPPGVIARDTYGRTEVVLNPPTIIEKAKEIIDTANPTPDPGGGGGNTPKPPTSKWNPFAWLKYLADWFVWILLTIIYFIGETLSRLTELNSLTAGLRNIVLAFFQTVPAEVMSVFTLGILFAILSAYLRRR